MIRRIQSFLLAFLLFFAPTMQIQAQAPSDEGDKPKHGFPDLDHPIKEDENGNKVYPFHTTTPDGTPITVPVTITDKKKKNPKNDNEKEKPSKNENQKETPSKEVQSEEDQKTDDTYDDINEDDTEVDFDEGPTPVDDGGDDSTSSPSNSDDTYDDINDDSGDESESQPNHPSRSHDNEGRERTTNSNSEKKSKRSNTYSELIQKGKKARKKIQDKSNATKQKQIILADKLAEVMLGNSNGNISEVYTGGLNLVDQDQSGKVLSALFDYSRFNSNLSLIPFASTLNAKQYQYEELRKMAAEKELRKFFPNVRETNLKALIRGRNMVRDWKIAQSAIGDALFNDLFIDANQAISDLQKSLNTTYVGPLDSSLFQIIQKMETNGQFRLVEYIEQNLDQIGKNYFKVDDAPYFVQEAVNSFNEASSKIQINGDLVGGADKILDARQILFSASGQTEESDIGPEDLLLGASFVGLTASRVISKGLVKYGFERALKNLVAKEDLKIVNALIYDYQRLKAGEVIEHSNLSPGLLHYLESSDFKGKISETFVDGKYVVKILEPGEDLYRYIMMLEGQNKTNPIGSFMTRTLYVTKRNSNKFLAIPHEVSHGVPIKPTFPHLIFEGKAADIAPKPGGGNQIFMFVDDRDFEKYQKWLGEPFELK